MNALVTKPTWVPNEPFQRVSLYVPWDNGAVGHVKATPVREHFLAYMTGGGPSQRDLYLGCSPDLQGAQAIVTRYITRTRREA